MVYGNKGVDIAFFVQYKKTSFMIDGGASHVENCLPIASFWFSPYVSREGAEAHER